MEKMESRLLKGLNDYNHMDEYYSMPSEPLMYHLTFCKKLMSFTPASTFGKVLLELG